MSESIIGCCDHAELLFGAFEDPVQITKYPLLWMRADFVIRDASRISTDFYVKNHFAQIVVPEARAILASHGDFPL